MKTIPQFTFHKNKYGSSLLIDVVDFDFIRKHIPQNITHTLTYYDVTFIIEGSGYFTIDNQTYNVKPYDVVFSIPGEVRLWDVENIREGFALIFEDEFLTSFFNDTSFVSNLKFFDADRNIFILNLTKETFSRIISLINNIRSEINEFTHKDEHILRAQLYETLMLLHREFMNISTNDEGTINKKLPARHINNFINLVNRDIKVNRTTRYYAGELCISPNYLNEIVQSALGTSVKVYIRNKLILEAKRLLLYTDMSIQQVSEELNFENVSYFIRFFGKYTGVTPLQFRKENIM